MGLHLRQKFLRGQNGRMIGSLLFCLPAGETPAAYEAACADPGGRRGAAVTLRWSGDLPAHDADGACRDAADFAAVDGMIGGGAGRVASP
jgi:hypothetical protein